LHALLSLPKSTVTAVTKASSASPDMQTTCLPITAVQCYHQLKENCIPADLWKRRLHGDSAEHSGTGTSTLAGSSSSALSRRPAKHAQHSTAPGMFVSAASLKADSTFGQQRRESTRPSQQRVTQPGPSQHRASWAADGVEERGEGSEVIDLIGSPGRMSKACPPAFQNSVVCVQLAERKMHLAEMPMSR